MLRNLSAMWESQVQSLGWEYPLEKVMATHSSVRALRIPWTEEPGGLQSLRPQRVRHDWVTNTHTHTHMFVLFQIIFHYVFSRWSRVRLFVTPWTIAHLCGAPLSMGFSRKEYCTGLPSPSPFFHYRLSQDIEYSSLCYTVGPCCLSILYIVVYIYTYTYIYLFILAS